MLKKRGKVVDQVVDVWVRTIAPPSAGASLYHFAYCFVVV